MKRGLDGLQVLAVSVLVDRLGGETLRLRDECRLAGSVKLAGEDTDDNDGEGCCCGCEGNALALAGSLALTEIVVAAAGDGGDDAQQLDAGIPLPPTICDSGMCRCAVFGVYAVVVLRVLVLLFTILL